MLPFLSPGDLPNPGIELGSPAMQADSLQAEPQRLIFNLYAEYILQNARLDEAQAEIKIAGRNMNNLRYADDTTLMAESKEEIKSLLMKMKEESEKADLKLNNQKAKILASGCITSWQIDGEIETSFIYLGSRITADGW